MSNKAVELVKEMWQLKVEIDELGDRQSFLQKKYDEIRMKSLPDAMTDQDLSSLTVEGVGRVNLRGDVYASIPAASKEAAYEWLEANGHGGMVQPYAQPGTLKAWARGMLRDGVELPEQLFKVTPYTFAVITKV